MKVVILAGGLGSRLREETEIKPKPMVEVVGLPIIWHIMNGYSVYEHKEFVICGGYKNEVIKNWFTNLRLFKSDVRIQVGESQHLEFMDDAHENGWDIVVSNTGAETQTGGRLFRIRKYLRDETFLCTYGDGLSNVDIDELIRFHKSHGKIATLTSVKPPTRFGVIDISSDGSIKSFREKPQTDSWVNAGFFVFEPQIFEYLNEDCVLEHGPLEKLAEDGQLMAFKHEGFWQPMDTYRDKLELESLWNAGNPPWTV
jgi:glucose-1-phosphate cytidylyltransferase